MPETLQSRLAELRHRLKQMTWLYGLSWLVAVVFGAVLFCGLLDWALHIEDAGLRLLFGLGILASAGWIAWRLLICPLRRQVSDVEIALRIEKRFPGFNDSLASTVQFLTMKNDPRLGSPALQEQVVNKTVEQVERLSLSDIVETHRVKKVAIWAVGICLLAATVAGINQAAAATALHRLMFPFANRPWPKTTELRLVDEKLEPLKYELAEPLRLAEGDSVDIYVEDLKGSLPEDVRMEYQFGDEEVISEMLRRTTLQAADGDPREVCIATIVATKGPMAFRAVGGDDFEMRWQHLEVVPPPMIESLEVTLTPPAYSGRPMETLPEGVGHVSGLVGTKVEVKATANKPLQLAKLRVKDQPPQSADLSNDGRHLEAEFVIAEAGVYSWWFDLKDLGGFENPNAPRYEVRGTADLVPEVWIDEPPRDKTVTPTAMVPLLVGAKDDLGLKEIRVQYKVGDDPKAPLTAIPLFDGDDRPTDRRVEYEWELADLKLQPGQFITFHAEAVDDCDLNGEHVGRSIARKLTIVSPEEKSAELSFHQGGLIDELATARDMQSRTHDQVEQLQIQLDTAGKFRFEDLDLLKRLEIEQRQTSARLSHPNEGLTAHAAELLKELEHNKIDDPEMKQRLTGIATEIGILQEDHLPLIEQELTNARKFAQTEQGQTPEEEPENTSSSRDAKTALAKADNNQQAVLDSLGELLAQLSEWRHHRDLTGEVQEAIGTQEEINKDTAALRPQTLGKGPRELTPQDQADLARLADRQRKQSQKVADLGDRLGDIGEELKDTSPGAAELLNDAADHLREQAVAGRLQDTANQLGRNQIGEATVQQRAALDALKELSDILKNRSVSDTETLVKKLKQAQSELAKLRERQEELKKKLEEAQETENQKEREKELETLRQQQQQIRREISSLARRLRRLEARESGSSLRRAASRIEQVEQLLQENRADEIEDEQQEILDDLEQAERELAQETQAAEERLAREMLEKIGDELKSMIARQQNVIEETNRLEGIRRENDWKRAELKSLRDLAVDQRHLKTETDRLVEIVKAAEVFALALRGAAREMEIAATRLEKRLTDGETVDRETAAKNRFVDLVAALETEKSKQENAAEGGGGARAGGGPQSDGIPHLAQLKMLKSLQEDLIRRTEDLDRLQKENGGLSGEEKLELDLLAGEQGLLADLARNLTAQFAETFEAKPENAGKKPEREEGKPQPKPTPAKKPTLEDQLKKDLELDELLPKDDSNDGEARRSNSESGLDGFGGFGYPAQLELKDPPTVKESKPSQPASEEFEKPEPTPLSKEDEALLDQLTGEDPAQADPSKNPLEDAITGMRSAQERISGKDTGKETREIQEDVVANLQKLIDLMKKSQSKPPSKGSPPMPPQNPQQQDSKNTDANPQNAATEPQNNSEQPQTTKKESENALDSTEDQRQGRDAKPNLAPRREMLTEVWGHLPPSVRDRLLNLGSDKYLPKYEDLARRYFEALAEPASGSNMKSPR